MIKILFPFVLAGAMFHVEHPILKVTAMERMLEAKCYAMPVTFEAKFCDVISPWTGEKYAVILVPQGAPAIVKQ